MGATARAEHVRSALAGSHAVDLDCVRIGSGRDGYERAVRALRGWQMFQLGWAELCWPSAPIEVGTTVGVLMRALGIWTLNACRIVYCIDERRAGEGGSVERFGFAYGTLPDHALSGEERFCVEWRAVDDSVWYELLRFSRTDALPRPVRPYARRLQRRFARDSQRAMRAATAG